MKFPADSESRRAWGTKDGEEVVMVDAEVVDVVDEVAGMRTRRRLSTSSWNGSGRLMLNHSV